MIEFKRNGRKRLRHVLSARLNPYTTGGVSISSSTVSSTLSLGTLVRVWNVWMFALSAVVYCEDHGLWRSPRLFGRTDSRRLRWHNAAPSHGSVQHRRHFRLDDRHLIVGVHAFEGAYMRTSKVSTHRVGCRYT